VAAVDALVRHHDVDLEGIRIHYVEAGAGPLVLLLHGFPDFWFGWRNQIPALAGAGFRVVAPDLRGYDLSSKPAGIGAYTVERIVEDISKLVRALGAERASVVGHDWGGAIAWTFAMRHPDQLERLAILNAPHPARFARAFRDPRQLAKSWYMFFFQLPALPEALLRARGYESIRRLFARDPVRPFDEEDVRRHVEAIARPGALTAMIDWYRALFRGSGRLRSSLRRIEAPTLVLWGDRDRYLSRPVSEPAREWVPDLTVAHFPNASHWLQHDEADAVNRRLVAFLEGAAR
jgi:pimeloyl-ACP methyl ester carboxylesterase